MNGKRKQVTNKLNLNKISKEVLLEVVPGSNLLMRRCVPTEDKSDDESTLVDKIVPEDGGAEVIYYFVLFIF